MANSRAGDGKYKMSMDHLVVPESRKVLSKKKHTENDGTCQKESI